jgi:hypothetical protein
MSFAAVINALGIPPEALVEQRVPKKLLLDNGAPTAADKRQIQDGIEEITWVAALKPTNIGVPAFQDEVRQYQELAVLTVALRDAAKPLRLVELIHRAIPYPVVLVAGRGEIVDLSLAHKRWSQGEADKIVLEGLRRVEVNLESPSTEETAFLDSLAVAQLPARDLFTMYEGWFARLDGLEAARITGRFSPPESPEHAAVLRDGLGQHARIKRDLAQLRVRAGQERQINRLVDVNLEIKRLETELAATLKTL